MTATLNFVIQNSITGYANNIIYTSMQVCNFWKKIATTPYALFSMTAKKQYKHILRNKNVLFHCNANPMCSSNVYVT